MRSLGDTIANSSNIALLRNVKILYIGNKLSSNGSTPTTIETLSPKLVAEGYDVVSASNRRNQLLRFADMMYAVIKNRNADVVLIDTYSTLAFYFAWAAASLASFLGIRYIPVLHGGNLPARFSGSPLLSKQLFSRSYINIAVSPYLQKHLQEHAYRNILIPNSIDIAGYRYKVRSAFRPRLLWVRAFHKTYDPHMAVRLLKILSETHKDAMLAMVGPEKDGSMNECKALAKELGVEDKITFTGKLDKSAWHTLAEEYDVFINTSRFDNMPVTIIEAMALGLPVVSTNVGGLQFMINNGVDGFLAKENNEHSMLQSIIHLLSDPKDASLAAAKARRKAESFDWDIVKKQWVALLEGLKK